MIVGGATPERPVSPCAPTAWPDPWSLANPAHDLAWPAHRSANAAHDLTRRRRPLQQCIGQELWRRRQRARAPLLLGWGDWHRVGRGVEQDGRDVDAGNAVDERMVGLR